MASITPLFLNNVSSTVQAGSSAIGSASATGINVATGDGANFGTIGTNQYIPAVVVDTSTTPETVKEYVWVTAIATDALTVTRQAEDSSRYAASTTTIAAGYTIAAVATRGALDRFCGAQRDIAYRPSGWIAETLPRYNSLVTSGQSILISGTLCIEPIALAVGTKVSNIAFVSGSQAAVSPTHWWFGLFDQNQVALAFSADKTSTAWATFTAVSLPIATIATGAASSFTTTYTGLHYLGIMVAAGTVPSLVGLPGDGGNWGTPFLAGRTNTGQTTVPGFPFTATTMTAQLSQAYGYVS